MLLNASKAFDLHDLVHVKLFKITPDSAGYVPNHDSLLHIVSVYTKNNVKSSEATWGFVRVRDLFQ